MSDLTLKAPRKKVFIMRTWHALVGGVFLTTLVGCQSMNSSTPAAGESELSAKQQDYETLLQEWQALKPGITRLLAIEEELNALLGELEHLQANLANAQKANASTTVAATPAAPAPAPVSTVAPVIPQSASGGNYALQVASITEAHLLPATWKSMVNKSPELMTTLEPNFQKIQVKNTDYYRLKVGSFASIQDASRTCGKLKVAGIPCFVVDYNGSNFSQLIN